MSTTNTIDLIIDKKAENYAKIYASLLKDEFQRKRAYASIAALYAFINLVEKTPEYILQKSMTLFRNPIINEQYEISDLYINGWHIDVRVVTGGDAVLVPKIHYDSDIVPDFYVVIKVDSSVHSAELIGIADTSSCEKEGFNYHYYSIPFTSLISYQEFLERIRNEKSINLSQESHNLFRNSYLGLMDNEISLQDKNQIIKHLFECSECRTEFCCFTGFEMVSVNVAKYPDILDDKTLDIIAAQNIENEDNEENENTIHDEEKEETISDVLDELFNIDESTVQYTPEDNPIETNISNLSVDSDKKEDAIIETVNDSDILNDSALPLAQENDMDMLYEYNSEDTNMEILSEPELEPEKLVNNQDEGILIDEDIKLTDTEETIVEENPQKVIIDYDEYGEPIYSYITAIDPDNAQSIESEIIPIDDEKNATGEELVNTNNIDSDLPELVSIDENTLSSEENNEISNDNTIEEISDYTIENSNIQSINDIDDNNEENNSDNIAVHPYENEMYANEEKAEYKEEEITESEPDEYELSDEIETIDDEVQAENEEYNENDEGYDDENEEEYEDNEEYEDEYDEDEEDDTLPEENLKKSSSKAALIFISLIVILGLIGSGAFLFMKNNKNANTTAESAAPSPDIQQTNTAFENTENTENTENIENTENAENTENNTFTADSNADNSSEYVPPLTEGDLITPNNNDNSNNSGDVNSVIANAFSQGSNNITLNGLNWFCTSELFSDKTFKNYLQNLDNTLKQNLKNNILNTTEIPTNRNVSAKLAVDNNGNLRKVMISESSGSDEIDNIVLQSINESFEGEKSPILNDSTLKSDMYYLKVVIKL